MSPIGKPGKKLPKSFYNITNEIRYSLREINERARGIDERVDSLIQMYRELFKKAHKDLYSSPDDPI